MMHLFFNTPITAPKNKGFTLAELLSALAILGVIATFTIPKVLQGSQNGQKLAITKEIAASISSAYSAYNLDSTPTSTTGPIDLTSYFNYVRLDTSSLIDEREGLTSANCAAANRVCMVLHNGATLAVYDTVNFAGTSSLNAVWFLVDPDGSYSGATTGSGKGVKLWLYYNGRLTSQGSIETGTLYSGGTSNPEPDVSWFEW